MSLPVTAEGGDRLRSITTDAEERWLAGTGPAPLRPAERLPPRAPVLMPHAGLSRWIKVVRHARTWVDSDGALWFRGPEPSAARLLVPPGQARCGWWLIDRGSVGARLPVVDAGWLVITGPDGPLTALRLADWLPGWPGASADGPLVRAAGAEALCHALGVPLQALGDPAEAARKVGAVDPRARVELDLGPYTFVALAFIASVLLLLAGIFVGLAGDLAAGLAVIGACLVLPAAADLLAWVRRRRRVHELPGQLDAWWPAAPARGVSGRGLGVRAGPAGQEIVIADGHGGECWLPGPECGGAAGIVAARGDSEQLPWALLLYDRGERILASLPGAEWLSGLASLQNLADAAGQLGMRVTPASQEPQPLAASRDRDRAAADPGRESGRRALPSEARQHADPGPSLVSRYSLSYAIPMAITTVLSSLPWPAKYGFTGWMAAMIASLLLARRRAVL